MGAPSNRAESDGQQQPPGPGQNGPERYRVQPSILRVDAFMSRFIFTGGLGVLVSITVLFFFILAAVLPLFRDARIEPIESIPTGISEPRLLGMDEWGELPFVAHADGSLIFFDQKGQLPPQTTPAPVPAGLRITSSAYLQEEQLIAYGLSNGQLLEGRVAYRPRFTADGTRLIEADVHWELPRRLDSAAGPITSLDLFLGETRKAVAGISEKAGKPMVVVVSLVRERRLFGASGFRLEEEADLAPRLGADPVAVRIGADAESVVIRDAVDKVHVFHWNGTGWDLRQRFHPFPETGAQITSMEFIQGRVSLCFTGSDGTNRIYSLYRHPGSGQRMYGATKAFPPFSSGATSFARSPRNKAFLLGDGMRLSLRYATTADVRWESVLDRPLSHLLIGSRFDVLGGIDPAGKIQLFRLDDPHPEGGFKAFFSKIWYEGQDRPRYLWQSTGGTDDFEPKLSLVPLIFGSLKGTFYALLFAVPIALLAAVYSSQFLSRELRTVIKPAIELMASLPSVVLGFLAALWLAPLIEDRVPSVLLMLVAVPVGALGLGVIWSRLPMGIRSRIPGGWEIVLVIPLLVVTAAAAWHLGPLFESLVFRYTDPATGETIGDFRLWWEAWSGNQFQQRNSLVVGFMMGFAVIPIIYTIAEDALYSVPQSLISGSLALGATRWQTTMRIVLPIASAGIFSAIMIGFGRAVGETMIVVMATGNTPILDFDIFSGMRTLSANIAVELPEAPHGGTLYRTLFLGALVLFILTFVLNTIAEMLRKHLRERYRILH